MSETADNFLNRQPILNIGCLGSVSEGKSTAVFQLTGTKTQRHSSEQKRNITIKPGYANMKIWVDKEGNYKSSNSETKEMEDYNLIHHLSFVDCPGHQDLILTMMGNVSLMKGALVVVSAENEITKDSKSQLVQHLAATKIVGLKNIIVILNKLDQVKKHVARDRKEQLDDLLKEMDITPRYIIPAILSKGIGIQNIIKAIMEVFPPDINIESKNVEFRITRSFDINKPGINWNEIKGGVIGGSLISGNINIGDKIEIKPGIVIKKKDGTVSKVVPITTTVLSLKSEAIELSKASSGGLIGIGTDIDPYYCKDGELEGNVMGLVGKLPDIFSDITINDVSLTTDFEGEWNPKIKDEVCLQIGNINTNSILLKINKDKMIFQLKNPICIYDNSLIIICSNKKDDIMRIVGYGNFNSKESKKIIL
jgi:translation initiation factor 2 subunit 3